MNCIYFLILIILHVAISQPQMPQPNSSHVNCYRSYNIQMRPTSLRVVNIQEERITYDYMQFSRHHIIPFATMRRFFNTLQTRDDASFERLFETVLVVAGENVGLHLNTAETMRAIRSYPIDDLPDILRNHVRGHYSGNNQVLLAHELYAWLPFNIYIGPRPTQRADDDRTDTFDGLSYVIVGELRGAQLQRIHREINDYLTGTINDPTSIIDTMGDLVRVTQQPYSFDPRHWRVRRGVNYYQFAIATEAIINNQNYRTLRSDDYCNIDGAAAFDRYNPDEFDRIQRRRRQTKIRKCIIQDDATKYDRYCMNSLNILKKLIEDNILTVDGSYIDFGSAATKTTSVSSDNCRPGLAATGGAVTGGLSAFAVCLLMGGAYIPFVGWFGCGIGSTVYGIGGAAIASTVSLAQCKL